jgi:uncharacterized membrane protein
MVFILVSFFLLAECVIFVVHADQWFDPAFTVETVQKMRMDGLGSISFANFDVHPPLHYYVQYLWSFLNPGLPSYFWAQQLSVLLGMFFLVFVYYGLTEFFGEKAGTFATVLMAFSTVYVHYAQEPRMYIMVLLLSAMIFCSVVKRFEGWWLWIGAIAAALLPFLHYLAAMAIPFYALMAYVVFRDDLRFKWRRLWAFFGIGVAATITSAIVYALPQAARVENMWFQPVSITSWISSLLFAFFMIEGMRAGIVYLCIYALFAIVVLYFAVWLWKMIFLGGHQGDQKISMRKKMLAMMGLSGATILIALMIIPWMGRFSNLYHHRFFLVITWMFAAMFYIALYDLWEKAHIKRFLVKGQRGKWFVFWANMAVVLVVLSLGIMWNQYEEGAHHELQDLEKQLSCSESLKFVHESAFSMLTFDLYTKENGCVWTNVISTGLSEKQGHSAGFDVVASERIYWNLTLPEGDYWIVQSNGPVKMDGVVDEIIPGDGVRLVHVVRGVLIQ